MTPQRTVSISSWTAPAEQAADFTVWPAHDRSTGGWKAEAALNGRLSLAIYMGVASVSLRPTIAEAHALIEALEWAIAHSEVARKKAEKAALKGSKRLSHGGVKKAGSDD